MKRKIIAGAVLLAAAGAASLASPSAAQGTCDSKERGLVFDLTMFRHPMEQKTITILKPDGTTSERPMNLNPFDLEAAHIFKIWDSKIHEIEAMGFSLPLYSKNGWNPFIK
jgi:hypothetical protein